MIFSLDPIKMVFKLNLQHSCRNLKEETYLKRGRIDNNLLILSIENAPQFEGMCFAVAVL